MQSAVSSTPEYPDSSRSSIYEGGVPSGSFSVPSWTKEQYKQQFTAIGYLHNYISGVKYDMMDIPVERRRHENEKVLMGYYASKVHTSRHDSVISGASDPLTSSDNSKRQPRLKHFASHTGRLGGDQTPVRSLMDQSIFSSEVCARGYRSYCSKLPIPDKENNKVLKRHNMWLPIVRWGITERKTHQDAPSLPSQLIADKSKSWLFTNSYITGPGAETKHKKAFDGSTTFPPLFGEMKLPAFVYQCTVDLDNEIYILGGLTPCYFYSDEKPDLSCFYVDGIKNLPPPILEDVVNNPGLVNNHDLYIVSSSSSRVCKPKMTGQIPPPMLCMTGSVLTKRHIFYYGGFEVKTETIIDEQTGKFFLKKRAYLNNTAYILDIMTFKFTKVELIAQPTKFTAYPSTVPRFGHSQVSVKVSSPSNSSKCSVCSPSGADDGSDSGDGQTKNDPSSPVSLPLEPRPQSGNSILGDKALLNKLSSSLNSGVYTILVMGGYRQTGEDDYETLRDLWKIEVTATSRGKRNYFKFAETALATMFPDVPENSDCDTWPGRRAFHACAVYDTTLLRRNMSEDVLLNNLRENFDIESEATSNAYASGDKSPPLTGRNDSGDSHHHHHSHTHQGCAMSPNLLRHTKASESTGKTFVIHGGSNKDHVYGDMWWFDLDSETWSYVSTFSNSDSKKAHTDCELTLVGHSIVQIGSSAVIIGGLTQKDVKKHWPLKEIHTQKRRGEELSEPASFRVIDMSCQVYHELNLSAPSDYSTSRWVERLRLTSASTIYANGFVYIVGGMLSNADVLNEVYLRGALSLCILPVITTPRYIVT